MNLDNKKLPSDRNFGLFFSLVLFLSGIYLYLYVGFISSLVLGICALLLLSISLLKSKILHPFNKLWIKFGILLGKIISPIVLGAIFFLVFSPIALIMKMFGRDELLLKQNNTDTYWKTRPIPGPESSSFKNQF